ncbi:MAG: SRPBCC domain-containing protein [Chitinophagaceae bacterium]|nr:SRPBCC domain-containing protein [Chitinophagaceae bacterium]
MKKLNFSIAVNAPKEKVWDVLWSEPTYRQWTAVFSEGSHAISDWQEGSKIQFMDGKGNGMFSVIEKKVPGTQMTFKHLGEIKDGQQKESEWAGALESYYLTAADGNTELRVEMDSAESFEPYFKDTFPKALQIVKQLSEQ